MNRKVTLFMSSLVCVSTLVLFQNCGSKEFAASSSSQSKNLPFVDEPGIQQHDNNLLVEVVPSPSPGKNPGTNPGANPGSGGSTGTGTGPGTGPGTGTGVPTSPSNLYNFVAGDAATCNASIVSRLGNGYPNCRIGGGCGISCGKPSASCPSANPSHYGACINASTDRSVTPPVSSLYACKLTFKSGASNTTQVASQAACLADVESIRRNNSPTTIITFDKVYFSGVLIKDFKWCKVVFGSGAWDAVDVTSQAKCKDHYQELKKNNPSKNIVKVVYDGTVIVQN